MSLLAIDGTDLDVPDSQRVRALKLLRKVTEGMLLMWDRGLHSYVMVKATLATGCDYLGRVPANIKFSVEKVLVDGSYLSWIYPDGKSKKKGCTLVSGAREANILSTPMGSNKATSPLRLGFTGTLKAKRPCNS